MRPLPLLFLAGCVATDAGPTRDQIALSRELAVRAAGPAQACTPIPLGPGSLQAVDARTLVLRDARTIWVNRLAADCPGLRPLATIVVEVRGGDYCRGDRIRAARPGEVVPGPICVLGDFTPYR